MTDHFIMKMQEKAAAFTKEHGIARSFLSSPPTVWTRQISLQIRTSPA